MARLFLPEPQVVHIQRAADLEIRRQIELTERYRVELPAVPEQGRVKPAAPLPPASPPTKR